MIAAYSKIPTVRNVETIKTYIGESDGSIMKLDGLYSSIQQIKEDKELIDFLSVRDAFTSDLLVIILDKMHPLKKKHDYYSICGIQVCDSWLTDMLTLLNSSKAIDTKLETDQLKKGKKSKEHVMHKESQDTIERNLKNEDGLKIDLCILLKAAFTKHHVFLLGSETQEFILRKRIDMAVVYDCVVFILELKSTINPLAQIRDNNYARIVKEHIKAEYSSFSSQIEYIVPVGIQLKEYRSPGYFSTTEVTYDNPLPFLEDQEEQSIPTKTKEVTENDIDSEQNDENASNEFEKDEENKKYVEKRRERVGKILEKIDWNQKLD